MLGDEPVDARLVDALGEGLRLVEVARLPRLTTTAETLFVRAGPPQLQVLACPSSVTVHPKPGDSVALRDDVDTLVGKLGECAIFVGAPEGHPAGLVAVRFAATDGRWWVEDLFARARPYRRLEFALRVNDREVVEAYLRPGDTLELAAGLLVRFLA